MKNLRLRYVSFRVSEDEFEQLTLLSEQGGARSLSAFVRRVMLGAALKEYQGDNFADKLTALDRRLSKLEDSISGLLATIGGSSTALNASGR